MAQTQPTTLEISAAAPARSPRRLPTMAPRPAERSTGDEDPKEPVHSFTDPVIPDT